MDDIISSLKEAYKCMNKDNKSFVSISDHIRHSISPKESYPGIMLNLDVDIIQRIIEILTNFRSLVLNNITKFQKKHISRVIESMNLIALAYIIIYNKNNDTSHIENAVREIKEEINICKEYNLLDDIQYSASSIFNIASFLMRMKEYKYSISVFKIVISISHKEELLAKSHKLVCQCFIALKYQINDDFMRVLLKSCDQINIVNTLVMINPPSNPDWISKMLSFILRNNKPGQYQNEIKQILPYFALHGDFKNLSKYEEYKNFFPNLQPPSIVYFNNEELDQCFSNCYQLFTNGIFTRCSTQTLKLLQNFPRSNQTPSILLALFFVYYWISISYDAIGRSDAAIFYSRQLTKVLYQYPFVSGFGVFLELRCRIHAQKLEKLNEVPPIQFDCPYNWDSVKVFYNAIMDYSVFNCDCLSGFYDIYKKYNNVIVQREAFHYFIIALRNFKCEIALEPFRSICSTSNETKALFLYHNVIENIKGFNFNELWKYNSNNSSCDLIKKNISLLNEAEKYAHGFISLTRNIKQLKALLIGTSDMEQTALLISSSVSTYLDKLLPSCGKYKLKFPLLSIVYLKITDIEPCLLIAYFCPLYPLSKPFVVRIEVGENVEEFLDCLEKIQDDNLKITSDIPRREWWTKKIQLDEELGKLINEFENRVLGFWKCLFAPISPIPSQSPIITCLSVFLQTIPQKNIDKVKSKIENTLGISFPKKIVFQNSNQKMTVQLLLGKYIHQIPWESLPFVTSNAISITRIPSMKITALQSSKQVPLYVNPHSAFYILNPKGDLLKTEENIGPIFKKLSWEGFVNKIPKQEEMSNMLQTNELFVYCGHGSGREFFDYDLLVTQRKHCKSTMLLMGCSSGKLFDEGEADPIGVPYLCMAAGAGAVVANLWNVTDGEIDRFLTTLLERMKKHGEENQFVLENAVLDSKKSCKLRYLTGSSPVIYGFPTLIHELI